MYSLNEQLLTHWGRVTHICVGNLTSIGSDNGLSPGRRQAIIWTNAGILLIGPLWTNFSEILIEIPTFSFKKMRLKVSSAKWRPFCFGLNVLIVSAFYEVHWVIQSIDWNWIHINASNYITRHWSTSLQSSCWLWRQLYRCTLLKMSISVRYKKSDTIFEWVYKIVSIWKETT